MLVSLIGSNRMLPLSVILLSCQAFFILIMSETSICTLFWAAVAMPAADMDICTC